jgi:transcriptional accessory protein Tex/SPT6
VDEEGPGPIVYKDAIRRTRLKMVKGTNRNVLQWRVNEEMKTCYHCDDMRYITLLIMNIKIWYDNWHQNAVYRHLGTSLVECRAGICAR